MGRKSNDITGLKFKNLTVINKSHNNGKNLFWECKCDCGEICYATSSDLNRGRHNYCKKCNDKKSHLTVLNLLYNNYIRNAKNRNYDFNLSVDEFEVLIKSNCYYCGSEPEQIFSKKGLKYELKYNGIDRMDNSEGYNNRNCVPACKFCNFGKSRFDLNEFLNWINKLKKNE